MSANPRQDDKASADPVRPQETLRDRIAQALAALRVSVHTAPWVEEWDGYVVRLELGRVNAETVADAVLPIMEEETKALRAAAWQEGFDAAESMDHVWGHVDHWEDWPANPYQRALVEEPQGGEQ